MKMTAVDTPQSEDIVKVANTLTGKDIIGGIGQHVDYKKVLYCGRQEPEALWLILGHFQCLVF